VAVISLGGIVVCKSLRIAGDKLNADIIQFARDEYKMLIGEKTAEDIKIKIGSAYPLEEKEEFLMKGRDLVSGLPREIAIDDNHVRHALARSIKVLIKAIKDAIEETPPELITDLMERGIILAGGGGLLRGLNHLIADETKMPVKITEDPLTAVVRGCGIVLEDIDAVKNVLTSTQYEPILK
jgi:rod shape-determining protein MreB